MLDTLQPTAPIDRQRYASHSCESLYCAVQTLTNCCLILAKELSNFCTLAFLSRRLSVVLPRLTLPIRGRPRWRPNDRFLIPSLLCLVNLSRPKSPDDTSGGSEELRIMLTVALGVCWRCVGGSVDVAEVAIKDFDCNSYYCDLFRVYKVPPTSELLTCKVCKLR